MEDNRQIINFALSSSSSVMPLKKYDVVLSFRGDDTRNNFISHLYDALKKEVETYIDYRLEKGDEISQALFNVIQDSHVSVVIFSENYASSKWCLDELTKILQCKRDHGQIVIPVFYKVDPSHVRKQTETYRKAFAKHEQDLNNSDDDKLQKWRLALRDAANLAGWDSRNRNESDFIKDIVKDVLQKLNIRYPVELKGLVGIEEHYATIESLLKIGSIDEVRVIGIWGMGGIGKTTLAHALYAKLSIEFEGHCFLKNVREQSEKIGLDALRNILFSELLREKILQVESHYVMRRLARKKVLIVFDDVATSEQLDDLISDYDSLAPGSRVIVTTRDKHIFSQVNEIYEVKELNNHDSLQLFCLNAFREKQPKIGYEELLESVIAYCKGNPLALKVLGARLRSRSKEAWQSEVRKLQKIPDVKIHNVLKLSFDGLDCTEQDIFLDIACFLKGNHRDDVTSLLDACGFFATAGIENLLDKSLITISEDNVIQMHDLIQEMGWKIVRQDSKDPGRRSRLWDPDEVYDVLKNNKNLVNLKEIDLTCSQDLIELPDLTHATNLEVLRLDECISLREVHSSILSLQKLQDLDLKDCTKIESLESEVHSKSLRIIDLENCSSLKKFSVFSEKLEQLWLVGTVIQELPSSIWRCEKLQLLSLMGCDNLESFGIGSKSSHDPVNASLQYLYLSSCKLVNESNLCLILDGMRSLSELYLKDCCNLRALPDSIGSLTSLVDLDLSGSNNVEMLSPNIKNLLKLEYLVLDNCRKLVSLPELPPSLKRLSAVNCTSLETNFSTQLLSVVNTDDHGGYVMVPGSQVPDMFMFGGEGDKITFPLLANSQNICGIICCIILPYLPHNNYGKVECYINKHHFDNLAIYSFSDHSSISDHLFLFSILFDRFGSLACDPNGITFEFSHENVGSSLKIEIKRCGIMPVYASQQIIPTEQCGSKRKAPSFKKEESSRPEKHIILFDTPSASNNDLNQTIEVSQEKDLSNNQVDNCSELVLFEKSQTLMEIDNPDWDPIDEIDSILSDSYKVSPMSTHSTCISEPNVKVILAKLETLLETSLEVISSNDEVKQQFHHVLEQLGRFEAEVPVRLHLVICKLKTLLEGFDFRFATSQKTIQDYDQLLQSRSFMTKQLGRVKVQQDQIKAKVTELKMKIENINSEIGEQEKESSVLDEAREKLKRELDHYDAESSKLKIQAAQWVPECKTILTDLKNSEPAYKVAVTNMKKYEDEWAQVKKNFVANEF